MNLVFPKNRKKNIAIFCLLIYIVFSFLSNTGATLGLSTNLNKHIEQHSLNYDSCLDGTICNLIQPKPAFSDSKIKFNRRDFQLNLNKILKFNSTIIFYAKIPCCFNFSSELFDEKCNKTNWDIYNDYGINNHLAMLKTIIIII